MSKRGNEWHDQRAVNQVFGTPVTIRDDHLVCCQLAEREVGASDSPAGLANQKLANPEKNMDIQAPMPRVVGFG